MAYDSQSLIKLTVEQMHEGIQIIDHDWKYVYVNAAAAKHGHQEVENLIGNKMTDIYPGIEKTLVFGVFQDVMQERHMRHLENEFVYPDQTKCWFELFIEPHAAGIMIRSIDISHRKKIEEQYMYSQKLEAIGRLAGGVAHDFNNKLGIMMLYCEMALGSASVKDPDVIRYIENILSAVSQATVLTRQLLAFGRKQVLDLRTYNLNDILKTGVESVRKFIGEHIEVNVHLSDELWRVNVDRSQIDQVILNLLINSKESIHGSGGVITIETANTELDKAYASRHPDVVPGDFVMLSISDNGVGMSKEVREKIFEPFFTTKEFGKSTGLGLASVHGIVNQSNGHIWAYSEEGIGTTFKIYFPRVIEKIESPSAPLAEYTTKGRGEKILLVEDDPLLREAFGQTLRAAGYIIISASTAEIAQEIFKQHDDIELLLTDVVLPKMSGRELANVLLKERPNLKCAFMSGYTENSIVHHGVLDTDSVLIQKPITTQNLLLTVRRVIDATLKKGIVG